MKKAIIATYLLCCIPFFTYAQNATNEKEIEKEVLEWRRHIHQHPERSFHEVATAHYVDSLLTSFGNIEVSHPTPTSVLGILRGSSPGKSVVFRADMDALPVQEETGLSFASIVPGVSHACGHDAHTAMLLGTAKMLSKMEKEIHGTVYFLFQHAEEEGTGGAQQIIETGVLKGVDAFFGMHVIPNYPAGHIGILPAGAASTSADGFNLTIEGKGSHGSMPQMGIDPIVTGAEIVMALQTVVSRNVTPGEMAAVSVGKFQSGNAPNVIPDKAEIAATIRTISEPTRQLVATRIKDIIQYITLANGATYKLDYIFGYPVIENDETLREQARQSAIKALGKQQVFDAPRMTASEDFSYYNEVAPTCFMILGVGDGAANHSPKFNPDEKAWINGVKTEVQIILDYLK